MADDTGSLYDNDFYAWTLAQVEALRSRSANALDWEQLAEEVEHVGASELRGAESLVELIIEHLHKLRAGNLWEPRRGWINEVGNYRRQLRKRLTPALRAKLEAELEELHRGALLRTEAKVVLDEPFFDPLDADLRWSLAELLGEKDDPLTSLAATRS